MAISADAQDKIIRNKLDVDERPLKRLAKSVCAVARQTQVSSLEDEKQAIDLDFTTYENTLRRILAILKANANELDRYEQERINIQAAYAQAEEEIAKLKTELSAEQAARDDRASYDQLATEIQTTASKSRKQQAAAIEKLKEEVSELEEEKAQYNAVWQTRKLGFDDIMHKLGILQREISGEKESAELREMDSDEEGAINDKSEVIDTEMSNVTAPENATAQISEPIAQDDKMDFS